MSPTDWVYGLIGGGLIGLAAAAYLLINGRILGASGIVGGLVDGTGRSQASERLAFIAGLLIAPGIAAFAFGGAETHLTDDIVLVIVAGLLVGAGTRIANGCTSGHGVRGISRLSVRGIVATLFYIGAGAVTVAAARGLLGVG